MKRFALALVLGAAFGPSAFADYTVNGRFMYVDREFDAAGFTGVNPQRPIRFAEVQVIEGTKIVGSGVTDATGNFLLSVQDTRVRDIYVRCLARRQTSSGVPIDVRAGNQSGDIWAVRTQTFTGHQPNQDVFIGTLVAAPDGGGEAFNLLDVTMDGADYLAFLRGPGPAPLLIVVFNAANPNLSSFNPGNNTITQARNAGYDDTVVLHEMGHYVVSNFSATHSNGGTHRLSDCNQNLMLAWEEGHATYWGLSVRRFFNLPHSSAYVRTTGLAGPGNLQFSFDIETQEPFVCRGATSETTVYSALWDITDRATTTDDSPGSEEAWDLMQAADPDYWRVMTSYLPGAANISLEDFWDGWFHPAINNGRHTEMVAIWRELGVEYFIDSFEPNDAVTEARLLAPGPTLYHQTFFADRDGDLIGAPDVDLFSFDAVAGATYTIETMNLLSDANTALELRDTDGTTVLASNNDRSASDASSLISYAPAQAGRRYVRSVHAADFGIYGSYDLRISVAGSGQDTDGDGHTVATDCNDADPTIFPGAPEACNGLDDDCDTQVDEGFDRDLDQYTTCGGDCNDVNAQVHPGAVELCNNIDDDCDTQVDEGFDGDGDGFSPCSGDCNDAAPLIHPNQPEACNQIDDNCNGLIDEEFDGDSDGFTACGGDCDDTNPLVNPGRPEQCDGVDQDCDLLVDEGFTDTDGDGQRDCVDPDDDNDGTPDATDCAPLAYTMSQPPIAAGAMVPQAIGTLARFTWEQVPETYVYNVYRGQVAIEGGWAFQSVCVLSEGTSTSYVDLTVPPVGYLFYYLQAGTNLCGEGSLGTGTGGTARPLAQPCAPQARDTDQDGILDVSDSCPLLANPAQSDADRDGRGDACDNCPATANPTQADRDANGQGDHCQDSDTDGFTADVDCRDDLASVHPGAAEVCNSLDDDCDGPVDEGFDQDNDGYTTCQGDCADSSPAVHPGATEVFNGVDDDCNNVIDDVIEVLTITRATYQVSQSRLTVEATTNYPVGSVTLSVTGFGTMTYVPAASLYRLTVAPVANPGTVTVTSTGGGSANATVVLD